MISKGIAAISTFLLLFLAVSAGSRPPTQGAGSAGIRTTIAVSRESLLPYEPVSVMLLLRNETTEDNRVVAAWRSFLSIGSTTPAGVKWRSYVADNEPDVRPPLPSARNFAPGETQKLLAHIDYEAPGGEHVFARPGVYLLKGTASDDGRFVSDDLEITVRQPTGLDARAYEFLRTSPIHRFFGEYTVHKYEYDHKTVQAVEKFIADFDGSEYSHLARMGLAFMWLRGVEGRRGRQQDQAKAVELLTQVADQAEDLLASEAEYHLGSILARRGDSVQANRHFQRSLTRMSSPYFRYLTEEALRQH
jgi:hypothetical protein